MNSACYQKSAYTYEANKFFRMSTKIAEIDI